MQKWTTADIPNQTGTQAVVTGGSSGLGFETALALARAGADLILAGKDGSAAHEALDAIRAASPGVLARFERLDLTSLQSIADFASRLTARNHPVDLLVHCAGVDESAQRSVTGDGFEMHLAVHFLGPFALTARLLPLLMWSRHPRVVVTSSLAHRQGIIDFDDLQCRRTYKARGAYAQSKLASLVFAQELERRSGKLGWRLASVAAHPGNAVSRVAERTEVRNLADWMQAGLPGKSVSDGALSVLFAATSPTALPGGFYGPSGNFELAGPPAAAQMDAKAKDRETAGRLWEIAEQLTGVRWSA